MISLSANTMEMMMTMRVKNGRGTEATVLFVDSITSYGLVRIDGATVPCRVDLSRWEVLDD